MPPRPSDKSFPPVGHRYRAIERVVREMRCHLSTPPTLGELAALTRLSPFHFDRVFREVTGIPAGAFMAALRVEEAQRLLLMTDIPVTEVCFELGYDSLGTFTTRFGQLVGLSPTAFRAFARELGTSDVDARLSAAFAGFPASGELSGAISGAPGADAFVWIGMFPKGLPADQPRSGALRRGDGRFALRAPPDGRYTVLAAALAPPSDWQRYFLTGDHVRVATTGSCRVEGGRLSQALGLELRTLRVTDPPILISLPLLALRSQQSARSGGGASDVSVSRAAAP